jgi:hypothetical protein
MASSMFAIPFRPTSTTGNGFSFICAACRRDKSTFRRARKALRVKPDASFAPSKTEPYDHIIFNPPSSAPNVYHTPQKFLPKSDPRRKLHSLAPVSSATPPSTRATSSPSTLETPVQSLRPVRKLHGKKYHLGQEEINEIQRLRAEDPRKWTRIALAEKFECSQFFVSLCCSSPIMAKENEDRLQAIKSKWGRKKTEAREDRQTRKRLWGRDA